MTADEIKAKLGVDDATVRLSDNGEFYWISVSRELEGQRYSNHWRVDRETTDAQISEAARAINHWWSGYTEK